MNTSTLQQQLRTLHLAAIAANYQALAQEAIAANWSYETYLARLFTLETERRTRNRRIRRIMEARFPYKRNWLISTLLWFPQLNKQQLPPC
ncbi:MAG: ATP-binding protein [Chloroflexota bacterium]